MSEYTRTAAERLASQNRNLRHDLAREKSAASLYLGLSLIGWSLVVAMALWPDPACANEQEFTSIVIRCQQSNDTCLKREWAYPSESDCEAANADVIAAIGKTDDIVIAYCVGAGE